MSNFYYNNIKLVCKKNSLLMKIINFFLKIFGNKRFMTNQWTTIGKIIYFPVDVENPLEYKYINILDHELIHVEQYKKWNILFSISYLFLPIPIIFAWCRFRWEREAYLKTWLLYSKNKEEDIDIISNILWKYYLCWPKSLMKKWFKKQVGLK